MHIEVNGHWFGLLGACESDEKSDKSLDAARKDVQKMVIMGMEFSQKGFQTCKGEVVELLSGGHLDQG